MISFVVSEFLKIMRIKKVSLKEMSKFIRKQRSYYFCICHERRKGSLSPGGIFFLLWSASQMKILFAFLKWNLRARVNPCSLLWFNKGNSRKPLFLNNTKVAHEIPKPLNNGVPLHLNNSPAIYLHRPHRPKIHFETAQSFFTIVSATIE